jgi:hypothetical protein
MLTLFSAILLTAGLVQCEHYSTTPVTGNEPVFLPDAPIKVIPAQASCRQDAIDWCKTYVRTKPNPRDPNPAISEEDCNNVVAIDEPWQCEWYEFLSYISLIYFVNVTCIGLGAIIPPLSIYARRTMK